MSHRDDPAGRGSRGILDKVAAVRKLHGGKGNLEGVEDKADDLQMESCLG